MSLVLYRKYRPQTFAEVVGQEHVVKTLMNSVASGIISHAYLFDGPRGSGKTTLARLLAKALNCQNRKEGESEPCNKCASCLEITNNSSLDLIEIDAASHRGIDEMRELREGIKFAPSRGKYKIFIIDECHQLTKEASNALLKTLEEPPSHAIFILATTEIHKMIPTIISRCQRFDFRKFTLPEIVQRLETIAKKEKVKIGKEALELIAINAGGALRDAESIFGQILNFEDAGRQIEPLEVKKILGLVETALIGQFSEFLSQKKAAQAIEFLNEIVKKGSDLPEFTKSLIGYLRQGLIIKIMGVELAGDIVAGLTKEEVEKLEKQMALFKEEELRKVIGLFMEAENKMKYSSIPQLPLELAIVEACESI
jgi:DNA polymerase-3 subunit gamma/tau